MESIFYSNLFIWIVISAAALLIDIITSSFLFVWFTIGGLCAIVAFCLGASTLWQVVIFFLVSAVLMITCYPFVRKLIKKTVKKLPTQEESLVGREYILSDDVVDRKIEKIDGIYWTLKNTGAPLKKGDKVIFTGIEGNKILIKKF